MIVFSFVAVMAVAKPVTSNMLRGGVITRILQLDPIYCLDTRGKCVACESYDCSLECTTCDDAEEDKKDKKEKKDKTKKNEEYYGCVCEGAESMNVFRDGIYYGQMVESINPIGSSFIKSVEPTNVEDVPPCECIANDFERIVNTGGSGGSGEGGGSGGSGEGEGEDEYDSCNSQCPGYVIFPVEYGGIEYFSECPCYVDP